MFGVVDQAGESSPFRPGDLQIIRDLGATAVGTARAENHDCLRALGAVPVEYGEGLLDRLAAVAPTVDAALDCGAHGFVRQMRQILPAGRIVTVSDFEAPSLGAQLAGGDPHNLRAASFASVLPLAADGHFAAEFPLSDLPAAHRLSEAGHLRGKILVRVADLDAKQPH